MNILIYILALSLSYNSVFASTASIRQALTESPSFSCNSPQGKFNNSNVKVNELKFKPLNSIQDFSFLNFDLISSRLKINADRLSALPESPQVYHYDFMASYTKSGAFLNNDQAQSRKENLLSPLIYNYDVDEPFASSNQFLRPGRGAKQFDSNPWIAFGQRHKGWTNGDGAFSRSYGYYNQGSRLKYSG